MGDGLHSEEVRGSGLHFWVPKTLRNRSKVMGEESVSFHLAGLLDVLNVKLQVHRGQDKIASVAISGVIQGQSHAGRQEGGVGGGSKEEEGG